MKGNSNLSREEQIEAQRKYSALIKERDRLLKERAAQRRSAKSKALAEAAAKAISDANDALQDPVDQQKPKLSFALDTARKRLGLTRREFDARVASIVEVRPAQPKRTPAPPVAKAPAPRVALSGSRRLITAAMRVAI